MEKLKFSVIVPAYNEERNIKKCIESLLNQKYRNLEIIVVNDGSKDRTREFCKEYERKRMILLIDKKKNEGQMKGIKDGCSRSRGSIISIIGGDQVVDKEFYAKAAKWFDNQKVVMVGGIENALNSGAAVKGSEFLDSLLRSDKPSYNTLISGGGMCIRKSVLDELGGFDKNAVWAEDMDLNIRVRKYCGKNGNITVKDPAIKLLAEYPESFREIFRRHYIWGSGRSVVMRKHNLVTKAFLLRIMYFPALVFFFAAQFFIPIAALLFLAALLFPAFYVSSKSYKSFVPVSVFLSAILVSYIRLVSTSIGTIRGLIKRPSRTS